MRVPIEDMIADAYENGYQDCLNDVAQIVELNEHVENIHTMLCDYINDNRRSDEE